MLKKNSLLFVFLMIILIILLSSCSIKTKHNLGTIIPSQDSFTFIRIHTILRYCDLNIDRCLVRDGYGSASGVLIDKNKKDDISYILTAEHVCVPNLGEIPSNISINDVHNEIIAITIDGEEHPAKIIDTDPVYDLCLLQIDYVDYKVVKIADEPVSYGDRVYNLAAPRGIWSPGMVMFFEGQFDGYSGHNAVYSIPAAPGSSGSPIFNEKGELVGILHSVAVHFDSAAFASRLRDIKRFLHDVM